MLFNVGRRGFNDGENLRCPPSIAPATDSHRRIKRRLRRPLDPRFSKPTRARCETTIRSVRRQIRRHRRLVNCSQTHSCSTTCMGTFANGARIGSIQVRQRRPCVTPKVASTAIAASTAVAVGVRQRCRSTVREQRGANLRDLDLGFGVRMDVKSEPAERAPIVMWAWGITCLFKVLSVGSIQRHAD